MTQNTLLGVPIEILSKREVFFLCKKWLIEDSKNNYHHQIVTVNPEFLMEARKNKIFLRVLQSADLRIADGFGLVCASVFLYGFKKKLFRMTGVELTDILAQLCAETGRKIYLLGAYGEVAEKAAQVLREKFPLLVIAGAEEGMSRKSTQRKVRLPKIDSGSQIGPVLDCDRGSGMTDEDVCARISASGADILLVAFGAPKQDMWIAENKERLSGIKIAVGVGGTFDYLAGVVPYAPRVLRMLGLEWLFRLITQPHRLGRIFTAVIRFPLAVISERLKK